ncbi:MAG: exodeoxyribonuclease VII large subunit [Clostridia bacterium]|nr:exodeoxyribonuclease VII large subunit [Clostridia bacterium]
MEYIFDENGNVLEREPKTVSQINEYIKNLIEDEVMLRDVLVSAEISNFKRHSSGHLYFTLKDASSEIRAVMFRAHASKVRFKLENGQRVIVRARVGVYEQAGTYQLYVSSITPEGIGDLHLAFEQLKSKLYEKGLFDESHKKPIPKFPKRIGIITSPTGAAVRDIINVASRRCPLCELVLFPSLVQGEDAPIDLIGGIEYFNITNSVDVIIIGRGGGSFEDLWAFNNEGLAYAIYNSKIPVISGVGHEIDYSICDFVSDVRASTPSAAAELATPSIFEITASLKTFKQRSLGAIELFLSDYRARLENIKRSSAFTNPENIIKLPKLKLEGAKSRFLSVAEASVYKKRAKFTEAVAKINALNPLNILSRGFAYVTQGENVIKSADELQIDSEIDIKFAKGAAKAVIKTKEG